MLITVIAHAQCVISAQGHRRGGAVGRSITIAKTAAACDAGVDTVQADVLTSREEDELAYCGSR